MGHKKCSQYECSVEEGHHHTHETCPCCGHEHVCYHSYHEHHQDFSQQLIEMADEAWMEVLKDKIKEHVESTGGKHLDQLAKMVAETNNNRWKLKMQADSSCKDFKQKIADFFHKKS